MTNDFYAIIPAGGAGTRLWPLSRQSQPKFLADLTGAGSSLLQQAVTRLQPLTANRVMVVTGQAHIEAVSRQLPQLNITDFVVEPSGRDSMAAIGLAAAILEKRHGDIVVGSFAADHIIIDEEAFQTAVTSAIEAAKNNYVTTIGIMPTAPNTGFGYIHAGNQLPLTTASPVYQVTEFLEKPNQETAEKYFASGEYRWNAGMFVARARVLLDVLSRFEPELYAGIMKLAQAWDTPTQAEAMDMTWSLLKKIAIDHAIAEPLAREGQVAVVPVSMGWSDVGDYNSLAEVISSSDQVAMGGVQYPVFRKDSPNSLVYTHSKPVVVLGVPEAVVVETETAIFVTTKDQAQNVKDVVNELPETLEYLR